VLVVALVAVVLDVAGLGPRDEGAVRANRLALGEANAAALGLPPLAPDLALVLAVEALDLVGRELVEERRKVVGRVGAERVGGDGRE